MNMRICEYITPRRRKIKITNFQSIRIYYIRISSRYIILILYLNVHMRVFIHILAYKYFLPSMNMKYANFLWQKFFRTAIQNTLNIIVINGS